MGQALYRKYRSKSLEEVVGQSHITQTLRNAISDGRISHAYLFTGPRGVGKTSIARILAYEVNGLPYDETATHLDIIEIDAASNRRIDEIRELRDRVQSAPAQAKYKVYIIDEVHMLTREAFNALLKTLEEPPAHAIFILATTEAHKLPETIVSRTQRFSFKPIEAKDAIKHLKSIAQSEKITISDDALALVVQHGGGSFRDSISLLDQASNLGKKIELSDVQAMLGIAPEEAVKQLYEQLITGTPQSVLALLKQLREQGFHAANIAKQLSDYVRLTLLEDTSRLSHHDAMALLEQLLGVSAAVDADMTFELALLSTVLRNTPSAPAPAVISAPAVQKEAPPSKKSVTSTTIAPQKTVDHSPKPEAKPVVEAVIEVPDVVYDQLDEATWQAILQAIKKHHNTLYGIARMAEPQIDGDNLTLSFKFAFHHKHINEARNKQIISEIISKLMGREITLNCTISSTKKAVKPSTSKASPAAPGDLGTISNIFGSAEVLES